MEAATQECGRKLQFRRRDTAPVAGVASFGDVVGYLVQPYIREQVRARWWSVTRSSLP